MKESVAWILITVFVCAIVVPIAWPQALLLCGWVAIIAGLGAGALLAIELFLHGGHDS